MSRVFFILLTWIAPVLGAVLFLSTPAQAQLEICNRTSYILYTAVAIQNAGTVETRGWTRVVPGDCKTAIDTPLTKTPYYVYARTSSAYSGDTRVWSGETNFCALEGNFDLKTPIGTMQCAQEEASMLPFSRINTKGLGVWAATFTESKALGTVDAARTAGLERLLRANGAKIAVIDGKPDKEVGNAMADFRKRMRLAATANTRDMFDALETEAMKNAAPSGYTICNDGDGEIWAAIAMRGLRDWVTRGWWKIAPASCAKAITQPLKADTVFVHAERHANAHLVTGKDRFCLTNNEFEVEGRGNCSKKLLDETGFAATTTKGLTGYVAHVGNQGLIASVKAPKR